MYRPTLLSSQSALLPEPTWFSFPHQSEHQGHATFLQTGALVQLKPEAPGPRSKVEDTVKLGFLVLCHVQDRAGALLGGWRRSQLSQRFCGSRYQPPSCSLGSRTLRGFLSWTLGSKLPLGSQGPALVGTGSYDPSCPGPASERMPAASWGSMQLRGTSLIHSKAFHPGLGRVWRGRA